jgi:hypothetical protein
MPVYEEGSASLPLLSTTVVSMTKAILWAWKG